MKRTIAAAMLAGFALAGCASYEPLWTPADLAALRAGGGSSAGINLTDPADLPGYHRRGERPPTIPETPAPERRVIETPPSPPDSRSPGQVLRPRDPNRPFSADGYGYQRQGPVITGPDGNHNIVGSTIFGPGGTTCNAVGASLFCN